MISLMVYLCAAFLNRLAVNDAPAAVETFMITSAAVYYNCGLIKTDHPDMQLDGFCNIPKVFGNTCQVRRLNMLQFHEVSISYIS